MSAKLTRSKERVAELGEVFTPGPIVDAMHALIPDESWADPTMIYLEPTCGNGQFVVAAVAEKLRHGLTIEQAVNTVFGMDRMQDNVNECHLRVMRLVAGELDRMGLSDKRHPERKRVTGRVLPMLANNVFKVPDSLTYISKSKWAKHPFYDEDPTGESSVVTKGSREHRRLGSRVRKILKAWEAYHGT